MSAGFLGALLLAGAVTKSDVQPMKLAVTNVVADSNSFTPEKGERMTWRYRLSVPARVTASIFDSRNLLVRNLTENENSNAGDRKLAWDGKDDRARLAPPGYYLLTIVAETGGESVRWDPSDSTGGKLIQATWVSADPATHTVHYALPSPGLVRILLGIRNGPSLRTLVDWVARSSGAHSEAWDGWDVSGVQQFDGSPQLDIAVWAYELPVNAVIVVPLTSTDSEGAMAADASEKSRAPERAQYFDFTPDRATRPVAAKHPLEMYNHWLHDRARCHDPQLRLTVPADAARDKSNVPLVAKPIAIRLETSEDEAAFIVNERFELVVYLDGHFVSEEEQGYLPLSWTLKPTMLTPGDHTVTFMVRGYDGHFGSASIRVRMAGEAGSTTPTATDRKGSEN